MDTTLGGPSILVSEGAEGGAENKDEQGGEQGQGDGKKKRKSATFAGDTAQAVGVSAGPSLLTAPSIVTDPNNAPQPSIELDDEEKVADFDLRGRA